jgi:GntR family transcriptional regulator
MDKARHGEIVRSRPAKGGPYTSLAQTSAGGEETNPRGPTAAKGLSRRPLFRQVHDVLAERITKGRWVPGATLPNELDLAREMGVSAGTLRKALDILEAERLVSRRQGRGTFVNDQASGDLAFRFHNARAANGAPACGTLRQVEISTGPAEERERSRLRLAPSESVFRIERLRLLDGSPCMLERSCVPEALFAGLTERAKPPYQIGEIAARYGMALGRAEERVSAINAHGTVAQRLEIPEGTAILQLDRVAYSIEGVAVEWRLAHCHLRDGYYGVDMR